MDDLEELAKLFYETYTYSKYQRASEILPWDALPEFWKKAYRAGTEKVAERVLEKLQTAVEASE